MFGGWPVGLRLFLSMWIFGLPLGTVLVRYMYAPLVPSWSICMEAPAIALLPMSLLCFVLGWVIKKGEQEEEHSMDWHRRNGKWRVQYQDGTVSQPFTEKVAKDYAEMYDGVVIPSSALDKLK